MGNIRDEKLIWISKEKREVIRLSNTTELTKTGPMSSDNDRTEQNHWYQGADFLFHVFKNSSKSRLRNLDSLHAFISAATKELMWLNDKEDEEVNFDWSDKNNNMTAKKDNYSVGPGVSH